MLETMSNGVLVNHAARGDETAWNEIVRSYTPLLRSVCRRFGLTGMDADDVGSRVWMRLLQNITRLRNPEALPGWLRTTTRRECQTLLRERGRDAALDSTGVAYPDAAPTDARLLADEQRVVLREAIAYLNDSDRRLLSLLFSDPPTPYAEIAVALSISIGAIGPTRQRILKRLRQAQVWRTYKPSV